MQTKESEQIKVLIVEDHQIVRMGLKMALQPEFLVVGEAADGLQSVKLANELKPDVVLMDIGLPQMDGVAATNIIKREIPAVRIIMLTSHNTDKDIVAALAAGADGYCLKEIPTSQLRLAIYAVAKGSAWLDPDIASRILGWAHGMPSVRRESGVANSGDFNLAEPELAVLRLIVEGLSTQGVATRLGVNPATIGGELRRIIDKLALSARS